MALELFERRGNHSSYIEYKLMIEKKLNYTNLLNITKRNIKNMFTFNHQEDFLRYRFELLKQWIKQHEEYTVSYVRSLTELINKLYLTSELNAYEQNYLSHYDTVIFNKIRNLKKIIVSFPTLPREDIFFRFSNINLCKYDNKRSHLSPKIKNADFLISNKRIIVNKEKTVFSINHNQIEEFKPSKYGLFLKTKTDELVCQSYDVYPIYIALERILKKQKFRF